MMGVALLLAFASNLGHWLIVDDNVAPADAIFVLGGELAGQTRTRHAMELYRSGLAPLVFFSGGTMLSTGLSCSSAALSREAALQLGLPITGTLIAAEAQSTYDEAVNLRRLAEAEGWSRVIVVTSPSHSRRASRTFRTVAPDLEIMVSAAPDPNFQPARWWDDESSLMAVLTELIKSAFYWRQYGVAPL